MKNKGKQYYIILILLVTALLVPSELVMAKTTQYISIDTFIKLMVNALELEVDESSTQSYIDAALKAGILYDNDFKDLNDNITRTDVAVLLNRADEYLHGDTLDANLLDTVLEKRISDIKKITKGKRESVAKIVAKGIIKGYSNGYYIQNREFRGNNYITSSGAKNVIKLMLNPKERAKISPDGQLIRTTNLPKGNKNQITTPPTDECPYIIKGYPTAKDYDYILESFPNSFYEKNFKYFRSRYSYQPKKLEDYASPVMLKKMSYQNEYYETQQAIKLYKDLWIKKIELNLQTRLNVDYRTIDDTWVDELQSTYFVASDNYIKQRDRDRIKKYVDEVKKNQVIIQSEIIAVEPSTLYYSTGFYVRAYVKFKFVSAKDFSNPDSLIYGGFYSKNKIKKGTIFESIIDIGIGTRNGSSDGSDYAVSGDWITN